MDVHDEGSGTAGSRRIAVVIAALAASLVAFFAACGGAGSERAGSPATGQGLGAGDAAQGQVVFTQSGCGSCHALADAGTNGRAGPNLDILKPNALKVAATVRNGVPPRMPSFAKRLSPREIDAVAVYVEEATGAEPAVADG